MHVDVVEVGARSLLHSKLVGFWAIDAAARTTFMNERMRAILGVTERQASDLALRDVVESTHAGLFEQQLAARRRSESGTYDLQIRRRDGSLAWLAVEARPLFDQAGANVGSVAFVFDITERVALEARYHHAQKMEAVGRLTGGVAHDFNNALSVVLTYAEALLAEFDDGNPMRADLEQIRGAALRSAALTRQLLAFSGAHAVERHPVDVDAVIAGLEKMVRRIIGEDVELVVRLDGLGSVLGDEGAFEQLLMNLIVNARDAMPRGGTLTLATSTDGDVLVLRVTDTGVGMDAATRARAFEPFFTTKARGKGTGLGLATVYGVVQQSGGTISLESELGRGATFEIRLPRVADAAASVRPRASDGPLPTGDETVLVVEDDPPVREAVCRALQRLGYRVLSAGTGAEALALAERSPIDVVVTDVVLPHVNGVDLAARLSAARPQLGVVCMSGYAEESTIRSALDAGYEFIRKPVTPAVLARKVRAAAAARSGGFTTSGNGGPGLANG